MIMKKNDDVVIYKQDIMDKEGKLNAVGTILLLGCFFVALTQIMNYLKDNIVDKDKVC